jgi:hypothetical protein
VGVYMFELEMWYERNKDNKLVFLHKWIFNDIEIAIEFCKDTFEIHIDEFEHSVSFGINNILVILKKVKNG